MGYAIEVELKNQLQELAVIFQDKNFVTFVRHTCFILVLVVHVVAVS